MSAVITELGLRDSVERIGLDHKVGPAGRLLTAQQRASVNLVRCLVKRPDLLVIDGALAPFDENRSARLKQLLIESSQGRALFMVLPNDRDVDGFDRLMRFQRGSVQLEAANGAPQAPPAAERKRAGEMVYN